MEVFRSWNLNLSDQLQLKKKTIPDYWSLKRPKQHHLLKNTTSCLRQQIPTGLNTVGPNLSPEQPDISPRRRPSQDQHFEIRRVANLLTAVREIMGWQLLSSLAALLGREQINLTLTRSRKRFFPENFGCGANSEARLHHPGVRLVTDLCQEKFHSEWFSGERKWTNQQSGSEFRFS